MEINAQELVQENTGDNQTSESQNELFSKLIMEYGKINENNNVNIILGIIAIATSSGAFIFAYKGDQEIKNLIHKLGFDIENFLTSAELKIKSKEEYYKSPVSTVTAKKEYQKELLQDGSKISSLLEKIGQEKLSILLQHAKIISLELKDKEMTEWIQDELDGYKSLETDKNKQKRFQKNPPPNRIIDGHFFIGASNHAIKPVKIKRKVFMSKPIAEVEDIIKRHDEGKVMTTIPYTIKENVKYLKDQQVDLLLPREEWKKIIFNTEQKLSQYLESHLFDK